MENTPQQEDTTPPPAVHKIAADLHDLGRIKSNVADMARQGAPIADIDAYIKAEGTTVEAIKALDQKSIGKYVDDIGRSIALGATFGFADKIAAALDTATGKGTYEENLARQRGQSADVSPGIKIPAEIGGAIASTVAAAPVTGPLAAISGAAKLPGIVRAIGSGAGYGGLTAAGESDNVTPGQVATGAAIGGAAGGVIQPAISGVMAAARPVVNTVRGFLNPTDEAARRVGTAVAADVKNGTAGFTPSQMATTEPAAVADMGGEITRGLARSAANTSPEARATLQTFADGRFGGQTDRATEFVRGIIGAKGDIGEATEQIRNAARAANKPAYDAAYAEGDRPIWNPVLEQLSASKSVQSAMRGAESKWSDWAAIDGFGAMNPPARVENGGILKFGGSGLRTFPNIQYWDYVARDLTGKAQAAAEAGNRSEAARFGGLATLVKGQLDKEVPEFQAARTGAAGFFGAQDALEAGQNFVSKSIDINDARRAVAKMSDSDRETFKFGFAGELLNKITGITDRADLTKRIGESQDARDRITLALGNTDAKKMFAFLDAESVMTRLGDAVKGNSSTARQLVELGLAGGTFGLDRSFGSTNDPEAMVKAGLVYGLARGQGKIDQNVVNKVADLLVSKDPRELLRGLNLIADDKALSARIKQMATSVGVRLGAQGGASIPPMMPGTFGTGP